MAGQGFASGVMTGFRQPLLVQIVHAVTTRSGTTVAIFLGWGVECNRDPVATPAVALFIVESIPFCDKTGEFLVSQPKGDWSPTRQISCHYGMASMGSAR